MSAIGPQIPAHLLSASATTPEDENDEEYGPAPPPQVGPQFPPRLDTQSSPREAGPQLPPHLANANKSTTPPPDVGQKIPAQAGPSIPYEDEGEEDAYLPALPPDLLAPKKRALGPSRSSEHSRKQYQAYDSDDSEEVGPMPAPAGSHVDSADDAVREFMEREERRRKADEEARKPKKLEREEWMLVPPSSSSVLGSLDPTKLKARQFSRSANPTPSSRDNTLWTETPAEKQARLKDEVEGKRKRATDVAADADDDAKRDDRKRRKYEAEMKAQVEEYNRRTRGESLLDIHQTSKAKAKNKDDGPPVIWDHARDMSLGGRLMDEDKRSKMINDSRALGDRFGRGKSGGFL